VEAAVLDGALPWEALKVLHEGMQIVHEKRMRELEE
jgi:hypothetical protein